MHNHGFGVCDCPTETSPEKLRVLAIALVMVAGFSVVELQVSHHSHSLSLVADAGHMVADVFAIAMSLLATWIARWPTSPQAPFGYRRVEILAALVNGIGLVIIAGWIGQEAIAQLQSPPAAEILTRPMALTALGGLGVHGINAVLLHSHTDDDLNLRGAFLHTLADALSCLGVLFVAAAVYWFDWQWMDSGVSVAIALLIFASAIPLIRQSLRILLEQTPPGITPEHIEQHLLTFGDITQVTQLRIWTIAPGQTYLTADLTVTGNPHRRDLLLNRLQTSLANEFSISESTLQMRSAPSVALSTLPNTKIRELIQTGTTDLDSIVPAKTEPNASRLLER